jgi:NAD(P) transhydrogenase subunit alpha
MSYTYASLKEDVIANMEEDSAEFEAAIPSIISRAQSYVQRRCDAVEIIRIEQVSASAGRRLTPLPSDVRVVKSMKAIVSATDVRSATKEQIESLGAKAIFVENVKGIEGEGAGGYATEMSEEYQKAQAELVSSHIAKQDIVITTSLIPGRAAPRLITDAQIATMKPGSVIFDLAVAQGGNVEGSKPDEVVVKHGVNIIGFSNTPAHLPADASALFARNHYNFLSAFWDKEAQRPVLDEEIGGAIRLTQGGKIVNERLLG